MSSPLATIPIGTTTPDTSIRPMTMHDVMGSDVDRVFMAGDSMGFGEPASIQPTGGIGFVVNGLFDRVPRQDTITGEIQTWETTLTVNAERVKHIKTGDAVVIRQKRYVISAMEPDGSGTCIMGLSEAING